MYPFKHMNNRFVQSMGVAAVAYIGFLGASWALSAFSRAASGFFYWVRFNLLPMSWEIALAIGVLWFLGSAISSSRNS
jgi:hypothetical protein